METQQSTDRGAAEFRVERMLQGDYNTILQEQEQFWGVSDDRLFSLHHPTFFYEFGDSAFVARADGRIVGYVMGFLAQTGPVGYLHLMAVRKGYRRRGIGVALHAHFERYALNRGARALKAITEANNDIAMAFLLGLGMRPLGLPDSTGTPVVRDYWGSGIDRVVFWKELPA